MSEYSRVVWSEGMFLRPQHFQQHDRYLEALVDGRCSGCGRSMGFGTLKLDPRQLAVGKLALVEARGIFRMARPSTCPRR